MKFILSEKEGNCDHESVCTLVFFREGAELSAEKETGKWEKWAEQEQEMWLT